MDILATCWNSGIPRRPHDQKRRICPLQLPIEGQSWWNRFVLSISGIQTGFIELVTPAANVLFNTHRRVSCIPLRNVKHWSDCVTLGCLQPVCTEHHEGMGTWPWEISTDPTLKSLFHTSFHLNWFKTLNEHHNSCYDRHSDVHNGRSERSADRNVFGRERDRSETRSSRSSARSWDGSRREEPSCHWVSMTSPVRRGEQMGWARYRKCHCEA